MCLSCRYGKLLKYALVRGGTRNSLAIREKLFKRREVPHYRPVDGFKLCRCLDDRARLRRQASGSQLVPKQPLDAVFDAWTPPRERDDVTDFSASLEEACEGRASFWRVQDKTRDDATEGLDLHADIIRSFRYVMACTCAQWATIGMWQYRFAYIYLIK